jgi:hypothetical protein
LPKDWTVDQIRQFQDYFDALMSGNLARRRMVKFMPAEFKLTETRQPPLKGVLHGVPAADFGSDELLYLPRNDRSHRL